MLGVSAMAVQNALVQISLKGAPSTAAMTSNVTQFAMSVGEMLVGGDPADIAESRKRAARTLPAILGFAVGCGFGAASEAAIGPTDTSRARSSASRPTWHLKSLQAVRANFW
jgi:uncharacterized membrane protein YoaK (UPF0700 family)